MYKKCKNHKDFILCIPLVHMSNLICVSVFFNVFMTFYTLNFQKVGKIMLSQIKYVKQNL